MVTQDLQRETLVLAKGVASNLKLVHTAVNRLLPIFIVPQRRFAIKHSVRSCPVGMQALHPLPLSLPLTETAEIKQTDIG